MFQSIFYPILAISLIVFWNSFSLGFGGDDYFGLLDYLRNLEGGSLFNLEFFLWQYGPQDTLFGFIYKVFGLNPTPFFVISYLLRMLTVASFFPVIRLFTANKRAIFLSMLFFSVTFSGIETTTWGFNMMSYLAISLLNIFFYNLIKSIKGPLINKHLFSSVLLYFTALILSPTRMGGLIIFALVMEVYFFLTSKLSFKSLGKSLVRVALFITAVLVIFAIGNTLANGKNLKERLVNAWESRTANTSESISAHLSSGNVKVLLHPIEQVGAIVYPTENESAHEGVYLAPRRAAAKMYGVFLIILILLLSSTIKVSKKYILIGAVFGLSISLFGGQAAKAGRHLFPLGVSVKWFLIGSYVLIIHFLLIVYYASRKNKISLLLVLSLIFTLSSIFVFWNRFPDSVHPTFHRYLITPAVGFTLFLAVLLSQVKRYKTLITLLVFVLIYTHAQSTYRYLKDLSANRSREINEGVRQSLPKIKELEETAVMGHPLVFYFQSDNQKVLYHNILFGFPPMVAINENLKFYPNLVYTDNWQEVVLAHKTGESLKRFSWPQEPVPIENIFSYRLDGKTLVETTEVTRQRLESI